MDGAATRLQAAQRSRIAKQRVAERRARPKGGVATPEHADERAEAEEPTIEEGLRVLAALRRVEQKRGGWWAPKWQTARVAPAPRSVEPGRALASRKVPDGLSTAELRAAMLHAMGEWASATGAAREGDLEGAARAAFDRMSRRLQGKLLRTEFAKGVEGLLRLDVDWADFDALWMKLIVFPGGGARETEHRPPATKRRRDKEPWRRAPSRWAWRGGREEFQPEHAPDRAEGGAVVADQFVQFFVARPRACLEMANIARDLDAVMDWFDREEMLLHEAFVALDTTGDGAISSGELTRILGGCDLHFAKEQCWGVFAVMNESSSSRRIAPTQFVAFWARLYLRRLEELEAPALADADGAASGWVKQRRERCELVIAAAAEFVRLQRDPATWMPVCCHVGREPANLERAPPLGDDDGAAADARAAAAGDAELDGARLRMRACNVVLARQIYRQIQSHELGHANPTAELALRSGSYGRAKADLKRAIALARGKSTRPLRETLDAALAAPDAATATAPQQLELPGPFANACREIGLARGSVLAESSPADMSAVAQRAATHHAHRWLNEPEWLVTQRVVVHEFGAEYPAKVTEYHATRKKKVRGEEFVVKDGRHELEYDDGVVMKVAMRSQTFRVVDREGRHMTPLWAPEQSAAAT